MRSRDDRVDLAAVREQVHQRAAAGHGADRRQHVAAAADAGDEFLRLQVAAAGQVNGRAVLEVEIHAFDHHPLGRRRAEQAGAGRKLGAEHRVVLQIAAVDREAVGHHQTSAGYRGQAAGFQAHIGGRDQRQGAAAGDRRAIGTGDRQAAEQGQRCGIGDGRRRRAASTGRCRRHRLSSPALSHVRALPLSGSHRSLARIPMRPRIRRAA